MTAVRRATPADAATLGRLLWDFNTEFDTETDEADVLAARFERLLAREDVIVVIGGADDAFALVTLRPAITVDEDDADTRRFYERHGFVNVEEGADHRMLCHVGPT